MCAQPILILFGWLWLVLIVVRKNTAGWLWLVAGTGLM